MLRRYIALLVSLSLIAGNYQPVYAQDFSIDQLPVPGSMITTTPAFVPLTLKGLIIHPENALKFDFIMDPGSGKLNGIPFNDEALKMMKYFLTSLTIPEDDLWVNLSPYEKGRIIQSNFGQTLMGRDLLAEDYVLKQLAASLIYPERSLGKEFWRAVYSKAAHQFGTTQIAVNTFNKVWIVPSEAVVWEHEGRALIVRSRLKVMLEEDYLALQKHAAVHSGVTSAGADTARAIVIPVLEKEVNEGRNFAQLRQMYQAMILAAWYKKALKTSILNKVYADKSKVRGQRSKPDEVNAIYQRYLSAYKKGAFNYIKDDIDPTTGQSVPRKYFSGGFSLEGPAEGTSFAKTVLTVVDGDFASLSSAQQHDIALASRPASTAGVVLVGADMKEDNAMASTSLLGSLLGALVMPIFRIGWDILLRDSDRDVRLDALDILVWSVKNQEKRYRKLLKALEDPYWQWPDNGQKIADMLAFGDVAIRQAAMDAVDGYDLNTDKKLSILQQALESSYVRVDQWAMDRIEKLLKDDPERKLMEFEKALRNPFVYRMAMDRINQWGIPADKKIQILRDLFEQEDYQGPVCRIAINDLRALMPKEELASLLLEKFEGKYDQLPAWAKETVDRKSAYAIFVSQGSLRLETSRGIQFCRTDHYAYKRGFTRYDLENRHLKNEYESPKLIKAVSKTGYTDLSAPEHQAGFSGWSNDAAMLGTGEITIISVIAAALISRFYYWKNYTLKGIMSEFNSTKSKIENLNAYFAKQNTIALIELLFNKDRIIRSKARQSLEKIGISKERIIQSYLEVLTSREFNDQERVIAAEGLNETGAIRQLKDLLRLLDPGAEWQVYVSVLVSLVSMNFYMDYEADFMAQKLEETYQQMNQATGQDLDDLVKRYNGYSDGLNILKDQRGVHRWEYQNRGYKTPWGDKRTLAKGWVLVRRNAAESEDEDDNAMMGVPKHLGGISLNANLMDLQIKRDGNGVPLPLSQQPLDQINIQGLVPQITSIRPVDLQELLR